MKYRKDINEYHIILIPNGSKSFCVRFAGVDEVEADVVGQSSACLVVFAEALEDLLLIAPVLKHLRGSLHKVTLHRSTYQDRSDDSQKREQQPNE